MKSKGQKLEIRVAEALKELYPEDNTIRVTKASSGGSHNTEIADVNTQKYYIECKAHKDKFFSRTVWNKLVNSIPLNSFKIPLYVIEDSETKDEYIMLKFDDLCDIIRQERFSV